MKVEFAPSAVSDLRDIERFLHSPSRASAEFSAIIHHGVQHLAQWPGTAVRREDLSTADVLFWFESPYFFVLREQPNRLMIVAVMHASRNIRRELRKRLRKEPVQ